MKSLTNCARVAPFFAFPLLSACLFFVKPSSQETASKGSLTEAAPASPSECAHEQLPAEVVTQPEIPPDFKVSAAVLSTLAKDPLAIFTLTPSPFEQPQSIPALMEANPGIFEYLPPDLRKQPDLREKAIALGASTGIRFTKDVKARVSPNANAAISYGSNPASNGYLADPRPVQGFSAGDTLKPLSTQTVGDQIWYQVTAQRKSSRAEDRENYESLSNVGGIPFEGYTMAIDPGWVPASVTEETILADHYISRECTFNGVQNGDLAVYVDFEEVGFESFDEMAYKLMALQEKGTVSPGDRFRIVWRVPADSRERLSLVWIPFE